MEKALCICFILLLTGCDDASKPKEVSTVDSTILNQADSTPVINPDNTVVLDSAGPSINPEDTNYRKLNR